MTNAVFPSIYQEVFDGMLFKRFSCVSTSQDAGSHAISRQKYLELPVVQTGGRVDERAYGHVTKTHYQNFSDAWITSFSCLWAPDGHFRLNRFCAQQLLTILWRLDLIFATAIPATLSNFYLSEQFFWAKYGFREHIIHEKVNDFIRNFNSCEFLNVDRDSFNIGRVPVSGYSLCRCESTLSLGSNGRQTA